MLITDISTHGLYTFEEVAGLIASGHVLLLGAEEHLLRRLPAGRWIGGTSANFMTQSGGVTARDRIFVNDITALADRVELRGYTATDLPEIAADYPDNGFTVLIVPGLSALHGSFAREVQTYPGVFNGPLFGWISGVHVEEIGVKSPKVFAGNAEPHTELAAAMHVHLKPGLATRVDIVNLFRQGDGAEIRFDEDGFASSGECWIAGQRTNLAQYLQQSAIDTRLPLVADYNGAMINVSIRAVDADNGTVEFYAPVFKDTAYRIAAPVADYVDEFNRQIAGTDTGAVAMSCNCILNYLYAELEGKRTGPLVGPITFGEIAYILLNQTLVLLSIERSDR